MSPLQWLAIPALATVLAAVAVYAKGRRAARGLSQEQRAAKLRAALDRPPTAAGDPGDGAGA